MIDVQGVLVPLITPFTDDMSSVSEVRLIRLMRRLIDRGAQGFVVGSDASEFASLSFSERKSLLEIVSRECANGLPVLVNVSAVSSMAALDLAQHAKRHGARGVILMPPHYGRYTAEEVQKHYKFVANFCDLPVLAVDIPDAHAGDLWDDVLSHRGIRLVEPLSSKWPDYAITAPHPTTDEFTAFDFQVSPLGLIHDAALKSVPDAGAGLAARAVRQFGTARLVKSLYSVHDIEAGPARMPLQTLTVDQIRSVDGLYDALAA